MSYSIKDLKNLVNSQKFQDFTEKNSRFINLGEKIYTRRKDLNLTQKELGELSSIPQNKISMLESGTYGEPGYNILSRLSNSLEISIDYLEDDSISRKTVELYNFILSKIKGKLDVMQYMKIPFFIDIEMVKNFGKQITNFTYIRRHYGPFDKKVYDYQKLFFCQNEKGIKDLKYIYLSEEEKDITNDVLKKIPKQDGEKLKNLSYKTGPLKKLGVKLGDNKCMGQILDLSC